MIPFSGTCTIYGLISTHNKNECTDDQHLPGDSEFRNRLNLSSHSDEFPGTVSHILHIQSATITILNVSFYCIDCMYNLL